MATQADFGWELPDLSDVADGPDAFLQFADDIAATIKDRGLTSYTPSWTSQGSQQPANPASRFGIYRIDHGLCTFNAKLVFGVTTLVGSGALQVGIPVPALNTVQHLVQCMLWTPSASAIWYGPGFIDSATNYQSVQPEFPVQNDRSDMLPWASIGGFLGRQTPYVPSNNGYPVMAGGYITIQGQYFVA